MNRSADIDRILAHIGTPEMEYQEFDTAPDTDQARANWSLLHSATTQENEARPPVRPDVPEQRAEAFRERVSERSGRMPPAPQPGPVETPPVVERAEERPLQQLFARISGKPTAPASRPAASTEQRGATPLSQVFKRLE